MRERENKKSQFWKAQTYYFFSQYFLQRRRKYSSVSSKKGHRPNGISVERSSRDWSRQNCVQKWSIHSLDGIGDGHLLSARSCLCREIKASYIKYGCQADLTTKCLGNTGEGSLAPEKKAIKVFFPHFWKD